LVGLLAFWVPMSVFVGGSVTLVVYAARELRRDREE
jgi:hypothetical protein